MSHGFDAATAAATATSAAAEPRVPGVLGTVDRAMRKLNAVLLTLGGIALVAGCIVLSYGVVIRYVFQLPTDWQGELSVFLILGAVFLSAAAVQAKRGHVAIEAVTGLLPPGVNRARLLFADVVSFVFVAFFAWKSCALLRDAWVDGQISDSSWGPPLWIPYSLMALGMSLLALQFAVQIVEGLAYGPRAAGWAKPKIGLGADLNGDPEARGNAMSGRVAER